MKRLGSVVGRVMLALQVTTERMMRKAKKEAVCTASPARRMSLACFVESAAAARPRTLEDSETPMRAAPLWMEVQQPLNESEEANTHVI